MGYRLPAPGYRLPATGYRLRATGYGLPATGYRLRDWSLVDRILEAHRQLTLSD